MTLRSMQEHESVTLQYAPTDYRRQGVVALVQPHVVGPRVLDMRCLDGGLAVNLAEQGLEVVGLDGFQEAVDLTNARAQAAGLSVPLAHAWDLERVPAAADGPFDCVVCADVLNHVPDERSTLAGMARRLRPGGRLILVVPAVPAMLGFRDQSLGHLRRFTRGQIQLLLDEAGFTVERCRYWNLLAYPFYAFIERSLGRRLSDTTRFRASRADSRILGPLLRFWYTRVEKRVAFPLGLSFFIVARRNAAASPVGASS